MFSLVAIVAVVGGLLVIPASPAVGFLMIVGGCVSAHRAMHAPDDVPTLVGLAMLVAMLWAIVEVATFIGQRLP